MVHFSNRIKMSVGAKNNCSADSTTKSIFLICDVIAVASCTHLVVLVVRYLLFVIASLRYRYRIYRKTTARCTTHNNHDVKTDRQN